MPTPARPPVLLGSAVLFAFFAIWTPRPLLPPSVLAPSLQTPPVLLTPVTPIPYADAAPILRALPGSLPAPLGQKTPAEIEAGWDDWVAAKQAIIGARLDQGDEDSVVNLWYYGTSFTAEPRLSAQNVARLNGRSATERILERRLDDLVAGIESPGANERLQFARRVVERDGVTPETREGKEQIRRRLRQANVRMLAEHDERQRRLAASKQRGDPTAALGTNYTLFSDRGLSSDTSLFSSVSIESALAALAASKGGGMLPPGGIGHVAIVGPGLDFTDKADGYDFYPPQTTQPFAVIDSLIRLGLATASLQVTTFDVSERVNQHIESAAQRARAGDRYIVQLPLDGDQRWAPGVVAFWKTFGGAIGKEVRALAAPADAGNVQMRAVSIGPEVVTAVTPRKLNIVLERLAPLAAGERYDLVIATNILVYYDLFEQNLALANAAAMLRSGGLFLSNTRVFPAIPLTLLDDYVTVPHRDGEGDHMFWYRRP